MIDPDGRKILYTSHFDDKFNNETVCRYDSNGNIVYIKETFKSGDIHERWYIVIMPIIGSMLDNPMIGRYTYSDGRVLYFNKNGTQTTKEEWEKELKEWEEWEDQQ